MAHDVNEKTGDYRINGIDAHTDYISLSNFMNCTAAVAACCTAGLALDNAVRAVSTLRVNKNRYDEFEVMGRRALMILSKNQNPVSFDQSIEYLAERPGEKAVIIYVNNINHTNHRDTTWLYDISFERLKGSDNVIICTGPRAADLAVRLDLGGFAPEQVMLVPHREELRAAVARTKGMIAVLTEIYDAKEILEVLRNDR